MELSKVLAHFLPAGIVIQYFLGGLLAAGLIGRVGITIVEWHIVWGTILGLISLILLILVRRKRLPQASRAAGITVVMLLVTVSLGFATFPSSGVLIRPYLAIFHQVLAAVIFGTATLTAYMTRRGI